MKHLKMLGLALVAVAALMAFAGSASAAPTLTSPTGTEYTGALTLTLSSSLLVKAVFANQTCTGSTMSDNIATDDEAHAKGPITTLTFSNCGTNDVTPLKNADGTYGWLTINQKGEVFGSNTRITFLNTSTGTHCIYGSTTNTKLGTLTPSSATGGTAVLDISASLPYYPESLSSQFICGSTETWSGTYTVTTPDVLNLG